jgi:hypothetical protein
MLIALLIVSVLDVSLTWLGIELGMITEANPLLAHAFALDGRLAVLSTVIVVAGSAWILHRYRHRVPWVRHAVVGLLAIRLGVLMLHLPWLMLAMR